MVVNEFWVLLLGLKNEKLGIRLEKVKVNFTMVLKGIIIMRDSNENNEQQQLPEGFTNICYKIVSPILLQKLINNFAVCKHYSGTLLLAEDVSHGF